MRFLIGLLISLPLIAAPQTLTPVWVEAGPLGEVLARVVIEQGSECPSLSIDKQPAVAMTLRTPVPEHFRPACEMKLPAGAKHVETASGQTLVLPVDDPTRIAVIGDTGCRLKKGDPTQDCNDPKKWPFRAVAAAAAKAKAQLVVHVGDYLYRETPCPSDEQKACGGSPSGDTWDTWNADFFTPAAPLLAASPWAFSRGNHESCKRAFTGWFYYLDPRPVPESCPDYSEPYLAVFGKFKLLMTDTSSARDGKVDAKDLERYTKLWKPFASEDAWLVEHHPVWAVKWDKDSGADRPLTEVMQQAYEAAGLRNIGLVLAGHTHLFEILSFTNGRPPHIVAGDGGTSLSESVQKDLKGETVFGTTVAGGASRHEFGFTVLEKKKDGWDLALRSPFSKKDLAECSIREKVVRCKGPGK